MAEKHPNTRNRNIEPEPLLVNRKVAASILGGVSVATIIRMELRGTLTPVRLNPSSTASQVFYRLSELREFIQTEAKEHS